MTDQEINGRPTLTYKDLSMAVLASLVLGAAWLVPNTPWAAACGWGAALLIAKLVTRPRAYLLFFLFGVLLHPIGFYWLNQTFYAFGGFSVVGTILLFALFVILSSLQLLLVPFLWRRSPQLLHTLHLSLPVAWVFTELMSFRIFPWQMAHTQAAFTSFVQVADIGGSLLISFVLLWIASCIVHGRRLRSRAIFPCTLLAACMLYGNFRLREFQNILEDSPRTVHVSLVQGNVSLEAKHSQFMYLSNLSRYKDLSRADSHRSDLIIWPETVMMEFINARTEWAEQDPRVPWFARGATLLFGALTYDTGNRYFNSAVAVLGNGKILPPSHKQILMPFGEYTPMGELLPWLQEINSTAGDFTPGDHIEIFQLPSRSGTFSTASLICYEDVVPSLARQASIDGAEVLVNQTNDAWFGNTIAPFQHHVIALFRAIENRRFLLRVTNTGLTAVVDPLGRTVQSLPVFEAGVLHADITPLVVRSPFQRMYGNAIWHLVSLLFVITCLISVLTRSLQAPLCGKHRWRLS